MLYVNCGERYEDMIDHRSYTQPGARFSKAPESFRARKAIF